MSKLLAETIPLALAAAVSPVVFLVQLATLTGERRLARGTAVAVGAALPLLAVGAFRRPARPVRLVLPFGDDQGRLRPGPGAGARFAVGLRALRRAPGDGASKEHRHAAGLKGSFLLGLAAMSSNVTTFAFYIPAMRFVALADVSHADQVAAALLVLLITLSVVLFPLLR